MEKKIIESSGAPAPIGPYSQAVLVDGFLFVSGQVPMDVATGELVQGTIEEETHQVMKNLASILKEADMDFRNVVKASIFLMDMQQFSAVNAAYGSYFSEDAPARETVQVAALPRGARVEISVIAARKK